LNTLGSQSMTLSLGVLLDATEHKL
jgi:hypothetical protein